MVCSVMPLPTMAAAALWALLVGSLVCPVACGRPVPQVRQALIDARESVTFLGHHRRGDQRAAELAAGDAAPAKARPSKSDRFNRSSQEIPQMVVERLTLSVVRSQPSASLEQVQGSGGHGARRGQLGGVQRSVVSGKRATYANLEVYYETKCPDSLNFLNTTMRYLWADDNMRSLLNVSMYPFGNAAMVPVANVSDGYQFWHPESTGSGFENVFVCQHEDEECLGNLIQACAIDLYPAEQHMALILCMAGQPEERVEKSSYDCMDSAGINRTLVSTCVRGADGNRIMSRLGNKTNSVPGRDWVPWVQLNDAHINESILFQEVCRVLDAENVAPASCAAA
eukprot:TRINITY_DN5102_c0_g2_i1.p1 TRINITY_DN5102_c0_g2~~TRINITY_DN5102_c0_g2_i1.p1  ORF type:complete len:340 (-),score=55.58 TRINITY_DN5102_c0_g2_i1:40-1059(-)